MKKLILFVLMMVPVVINAELEQQEKAQLLKKCVVKMNMEASKIMCSHSELSDEFKGNDVEKIYVECGKNAESCPALIQFITQRMLSRKKLNQN